MDPRTTIAAFDAFLAERRLRLEAVGWRDRVVKVFEGNAIVLSTLSRLDLLRSKLFGLCDRAADLGDCLALAPTESELEAIEPWLAEQDGNPDWPRHTQDVLVDLRRRLGHGV
jgi:hypothetical protein